MDSTSLPAQTLQQRRAELRGVRRQKLGKHIWQFSAISGMAAALTWGATLPYWTLAHPSQVEILGNQLLSTEQVRQILSLRYPPISLAITHPAVETGKTLKLSPLLDATLTRHIFPSRLVVQIQERQPVAIAYQDNRLGYLDAQGVFIPRSFYRQQLPSLPPNTLKVLGYSPRYQQNWREVYPLLRNFSPPIREVHWQNPSNFILKTHLGKVHFGPYSTAIGKQLQQLTQLKSLGNHLPLGDIIYLDLSNPDAPRVQLREKPTQKSLNSLVRKQ